MSHVAIRRNKKCGSPETEAGLIDTKSIKEACVSRIEQQQQQKPE